MVFFFHKYNVILFYFFFFQAEDGIRDLIVTGVQTCALPISRCRPADATGWPCLRSTSARTPGCRGGAESARGSAAPDAHGSLLPGCPIPPALHVRPISWRP